ncbi:MAG TPA: hypothetical protein PK668_00815 [Myxococcota bacterium]|nr:hypothetical protein [Myxococcota bacterium]HRY95626.1 hypothetical protein [Myxococcota bacterium]
MNARKMPFLAVPALLALGLLPAQGALAQTEPDEFLDDQAAPPDSGSGGAVWAEEGDRVAYDDGAVAEDMPQDRPPVEGEVDATFFFDYLAPYGDWMWTPEHGWVWHPTGVDTDWRPYSTGYWINTEYGWTWVADEPWGWAPFHYGRWSWMDPVGWIWVPGTTWGPGWVMWRYSDTYIGWAPLLAGYDWWFGWAFYPVFYSHWLFEEWGHFGRHHHGHRHHYSGRDEARDHFRHTYFPRGCRDASNPACQRGPASRLVEKRSGFPVERMPVRNLAAEPRKVSRSELSRLGLKGNELTIYKPSVGKSGLGTLGGNPSKPGARPRVIDFGIAPDNSRALRPADSDGSGSYDGLRRRPTPGADIEPNRPPKVSRDRPAGNRMPGSIVSGPDGMRPAPSNNRPGFAPSNSRPGFAPSNNRPGFAPSNNRPGFAPSNNRPSYSPGHNSKPGFAPSHNKPSGSGDRPSFKPSSSGSRDSGHRSSSGGGGGGHRSSSGGGGSKGSSSGGHSSGGKRK